MRDANEYLRHFSAGLTMFWEYQAGAPKEHLVPLPRALNT